MNDKKIRSLVLIIYSIILQLIGKIVYMYFIVRVNLIINFILNCLFV